MGTEGGSLSTSSLQDEFSGPVPFETLKTPPSIPLRCLPSPLPLAPLPLETTGGGAILSLRFFLGYVCAPSVGLFSNRVSFTTCVLSSGSAKFFFSRALPFFKT